MSSPFVKLPDIKLPHPNIDVIQLFALPGPNNVALVHTETAVYEYNVKSNEISLLIPAYDTQISTYSGMVVGKEETYVFDTGYRYPNIIIISSGSSTRKYIENFDLIQYAPNNGEQEYCYLNGQIHTLTLNFHIKMTVPCESRNVLMTAERTDLPTIESPNIVTIQNRIFIFGGWYERRIFMWNGYNWKCLEIEMPEETVPSLSTFIPFGDHLVFVFCFGADGKGMIYILDMKHKVWHKSTHSIPIALNSDLDTVHVVQNMEDVHILDFNDSKEHYKSSLIGLIPKALYKVFYKPQECVVFGWIRETQIQVITKDIPLGLKKLVAMYYQSF
eukprot:265787_1